MARPAAIDPDQAPLDAVWLDVRSPEELASGVVPDSVHAPLADLPDAAEHLKGRTIITYCSGGVRSALAAELLHENGFGWVAYLAGGFDEWRRHGRPMEIPEDASANARFVRQIALPGFGEAAQERLREATVAVVGVGGLGASAALHLGSAGVGTLRLIDGDVVDITNLHRQPIHDESGIGSPKVEVAADRLVAINGQVTVETRQTVLEPSNALRLLEGVDVVVDATDRIPARYAINDAAIALGIPMVHASVFRFEGRLSVFDPPNGPCYRCLHPDEPEPGSVPSCEVAGVLGVVPAMLGTMEATETIKLLTGIGNPLLGSVLVYDALTQESLTFRVPRDPDCRACSI